MPNTQIRKFGRSVQLTQRAAATRGIGGDHNPTRRQVYPIVCRRKHRDGYVTPRERPQSYTVIVVCGCVVCNAVVLHVCRSTDSYRYIEHKSNVVWAEKGKRRVLAINAPFVLIVGCTTCAGSTSQFITPGSSAARNPGTAVHRMTSPMSKTCTNCVRRVGTASIKFAICDLGVRGCVGIGMTCLLRTTTVRFGCIGAWEREARNDVYGNGHTGASFLSHGTSFADPASDYTVPSMCISRMLYDAYLGQNVKHNSCRRDFNTDAQDTGTIRILTTSAHTSS